MARKKHPESAGNSIGRLSQKEAGNSIDRLSQKETGNSMGRLSQEETGNNVDRLSQKETGNSMGRLSQKETGNSMGRLSQKETGNSTGRQKQPESNGKGNRIHKIRKYLKIETEVEIFACAHITGMIFLYGFLQWLGEGGAVPFPILLGQMVLGYVDAWVQKALFFGEKSYTDWEYRVRGILWCAIPGCLTAAAGNLGGWFPQGGAMELLFYGLVFAYFILLWLFLENVYRKETEEINQLLEKRKKKMEGSSQAKAMPK